MNNMADQSQEQVQAQVALAMRGMAGITGRRKGNIIGAIAASGKYIPFIKHGNAFEDI